MTKEEQRAYQREYRLSHKKEIQNYRDSHKEESKAYYAANKELHKSIQLRLRYGLTLERYNNMLISQNNRCCGCKNIFDVSNKGTTPCVDHCHDTNKIRGILCGNCNRGIGLLKNNLQTLANLIKYLEFFV